MEVEVAAMLVALRDAMNDDKTKKRPALKRAGRC